MGKGLKIEMRLVGFFFFHSDTNRLDRNEHFGRELEKSEIG